MILLELELENFKQFRGKHVFNPTPSGVIGIIGTNGAGKTTLFEAIEWCLYQPREIRSDEIPPRGEDSGRPRVRLRLANPHTGATFEIERILKKTAATAEIVEIGPDGERTVLATGSTTVSGYTASRLIGLEHKAFVATFFTRQKELSFFGALKPTDRRREVGRLLGLETIRTAQERIAEERTAKRNVSSALLSQYDHESGQRDFAAEKAAAFQRLSEIDVQIAEQSAALITAEAEYRDASNQRSALVEKREAALRVKSERDQCELKVRQAASAIEAATRELERIADMEKERPSLVELSNRVEAIGSEVLRLELAKEQSGRLASLVQQRKQIAQDQLRTREAVQAATQVGFPAWEGRSLREEDDLGWIERLLGSAQSVDARATEVRLNGLTKLLEVQTAVRTADQNLERYQTGINQLHDKVAVLLAEGEPDVREKRVNEVRDEAQRTNVVHLASIGALRSALAELTAITRHDHANLEGTVCPTCLRTFTPEELEQSRLQLERRADEHRAQIANLEAESGRLQARMAVCDADLKAFRQIRDELLTLRERITNGEKTIADVRSNREMLCSSQGELASLHSHPEIVTDDELVEIKRNLSVERSVETARAVLEQARESLKQLAARDAELAGAIDAMGTVQFDAAQLRQARADQDKARSAIERLRYLDEMQERAPEHHRTILEATGERDSAAADIVRLDEQLVDAPLDIAFLDRAEMNVDRFRQNVQAVQSRIEFQRRARQDVDRDLTQIDYGRKQARCNRVAGRDGQSRI